MKTVLVTTFYNERVKERMDELLHCIRINVGCSKIDKIVLLVEEGTEKAINHPKIEWKFQERRPTYNDFFRVANDTNFGIKIIANTDIYFDDYHLGLIEASLGDNQCYALSRWDVQLSGHHIHHASPDSQDVWIFRGKIRNINGNFFIGKPACDNRIAHEIAEAGYEIINPSRTIKTFHYHITGIHNYKRVESEVIPKPYKFLPPMFLGEKQRTDIKQNEDGSIVRIPIEREDIKATEYDRAKQEAQMKAMLKEGNIPRGYLLTICIPRIHSRDKLFRPLYKKLVSQIVKHNLSREVQILEELDNGYAPIGWKRNKLNIESRGDYVMHLDDDDDVSDNYVYEVVKTIRDNYGVDVVTFDTIVTFDGTNPLKWITNRQYKKNDPPVEVDGQRIQYRMPSHLNAIRRECALQNAFYVFNKKDAKNRRDRQDNGSDVHYSLDMVRDNVLQSDVHIDKVLYYYLYKHKV